MGVTTAAWARYEDALRHQGQSLTTRRELRDRNGEAETLNALADTFYATGHTDDAVGHYNSALAVALEIGDPYEQARALDGLARARRDAARTTSTAQ